MLVESSKAVRHGFVLTEAELRRLVETIDEQFQKLDGKPKPTREFKWKFRNGVIAKTDLLEDVLSQENVGSSGIVRLSASFKSVANELAEFAVSFEFLNTDIEEEDGMAPIRYKVLGSNRDWVFVTSTQLDERIEKVRRFAPNELYGRRMFRMLFITIAFPLSLAAALVGTYADKRSTAGAASGALEAAIQKGEIKNPVDALLILEKARDRASEASFLSSIYPICGIVAIIIIIGMIFAFMSKYYPVFNFCWGDYTQLFERKEAVRKYVVGGILIALVISVIGSVIANLMHFGR